MKETDFNEAVDRVAKSHKLSGSKRDKFVELARMFADRSTPDGRAKYNQAIDELADHSKVSDLIILVALNHLARLCIAAGFRELAEVLRSMAGDNES